MTLVPSLLQDGTDTNRSKALSEEEYQKERSVHFMYFQRCRLTRDIAGPSPLVKYYLLAYNVFSALGWSYVLLLTLMHLSGLSPMPPSATHSSVSSLSSYIPASLARFLPSSTLQFRHASHSPMVRKLEKILPSELLPLLHRACTTYAAVGSQTAFVQSFAALEVLHCLLGFVRSPIGTTGAQVASRLYLVWGITALFPNVSPSTLDETDCPKASCLTALLSAFTDTRASALCKHGPLLVHHRGDSVHVLRVLAPRT